MSKPLIGFIGQGWIGKNYADNFEERGYEVVRYSLEEPYVKNKAKIADCDLTFIAVPTPHLPEKGFDYSIVEAALELVGKEKIAIVKSTIAVGTTDKLQAKYPDKYIFHSPEFLTEKTAKYDSANPDRNIVGYTEHSKRMGQKVLAVLPAAPYEAIIPCREAELIKYAGNVFLYFKVIWANLVYDVAEKNNLDYDLIKEGVMGDKRIGRTHMDIFHLGGRGAGGHCFVKDFATFKQMYQETADPKLGEDVLSALEEYNKFLLKSSHKSEDILKSVYAK